MKCARILTDEEGKSYFDEIEIAMDLVNFAPPAAPLFLTPFQKASEYAFARIKAGVEEDWHRAPAPILAIFLEGIFEIRVSRGERRFFKAGDALFVLDTTGTGHWVKIAGPEDGIYFMVKIF